MKQKWLHSYCCCHSTWLSLLQSLKEEWNTECWKIYCIYLRNGKYFLSQFEPIRTENMHLIQDNAKPHVANATLNHINARNIWLLLQPPLMGLLVLISTMTLSLDSPTSKWYKTRSCPELQNKMGLHLIIHLIMYVSGSIGHSMRHGLGDGCWLNGQLGLRI